MSHSNIYFARIKRFPEECTNDPDYIDVLFHLKKMLEGEEKVDEMLEDKWIEDIETKYLTSLSIYDSKSEGSKSDKPDGSNSEDSNSEDSNSDQSENSKSEDSKSDKSEGSKSEDSKSDQFEDSRSEDSEQGIEKFLKGGSEVLLHPKSKYYFVTNELWPLLQEKIFRQSQDIKEKQYFFEIAEDCTEIQSYYNKKMLLIEVS
ncbi:MAG: hypothetical protein ACRCU2_32360 [Planktothrix sp.]